AEDAGGHPAEVLEGLLDALGPVVLPLGEEGAAVEPAGGAEHDGHEGDAGRPGGGPDDLLAEGDLPLLSRLRLAAGGGGRAARGTGARMAWSERSGTSQPCSASSCWTTTALPSAESW